MQNTPTSPVPVHVVFARLHVGGLALAAAITAFVLGLITWPIHAAMFGRTWGRYQMGGPWGPPAGAHAPYMAHPGYFWIGYLIWIIVVAIWSAIGGAILAALYNAFSATRRARPIDG